MSSNQVAIIGQTASGKTALAVELATKLDAVILSLDSLSVYKEIDIASAKPKRQILEQIKHFGINEIFVNEHFSVMDFLDLYKKARAYAKKKPLIIVGGTSFYLKVLIDGISIMPPLKNKDQIQDLMQDLKKAYEFLKNKDPLIAQKILPNDAYRIKKAISIILSTGDLASRWFKENPPQKIVPDLELFCIEVPKEELVKNINLRTEEMFEQGLIDEACFLERKYSQNLKALQSIGLKEVYEYLNGKISLSQCKELVKIHTRQLAKRQDTFNKSQFSGVKRLEKDRILKEIYAYLRF